MSGLKMSILYLGRVDCIRNHLVACDDPERMISSPMVATLIQHPTLGNILYDTGNSPYWDWEYSEHLNEVYPITEFISIKDALAEKGLTPDDIDILIMSHLHFDHTGGLRYFKGTKAIKNIIIAEEDLKAACLAAFTGQEESSAYQRSLWDVEGAVYKPINGEVDLADDLKLFVQKSHTPGVIGMIIKTDNHGTILSTGDTLYTRDSYEQQIPPGGNINKTQQEFFDQANLIKTMQEQYDATIFFGHDYDQVREWNAKGWID